jgi:hypothetical protein
MLTSIPTAVALLVTILPCSLGSPMPAPFNPGPKVTDIDIAKVPDSLDTAQIADQFQSVMDADNFNNGGCQLIIGAGITGPQATAALYTNNEFVKAFDVQVEEHPDSYERTLTGEYAEYPENSNSNFRMTFPGVSCDGQIDFKQRYKSVGLSSDIRPKAFCVVHGHVIFYVLKIYCKSWAEGVESPPPSDDSHTLL